MALEYRGRFGEVVLDPFGDGPEIEGFGWNPFTAIGSTLKSAVSSVYSSAVKPVITAAIPIASAVVAGKLGVQQPPAPPVGLSYNDQMALQQQAQQAAAQAAAAQQQGALAMITPKGLPSWAIPAGLGVAGLLAVMLLRGKKSNPRRGRGRRVRRYRRR